MEIRSYMKSIQDSIGYVLTSEGYSARVLRVKQGPLTLSYRIQLIEAKAGDMERVLGFSSIFETYTGIGPVRVTKEIGTVAIEFPSPDPVTPHGSLLSAKGQGANLCIGFDTWGDPVFLTLPRYPNLLISGPPRSGKTSAMRSIVYAALRTSQGKVNVSICAEKVEYWKAFSKVQGFAGLYAQRETINPFLHSLAEEMRSYAAEGKRFSPVRILVLDDLISILSGNGEVRDDLKALVSTGGSVGCYVFMGTQSVGSKEGTGGLVVEDNVPARLLYRASSRSSAARGTGEGAEGLADLTDTQGDALFKLGHRSTRVATGFVTDQDIIEDLPPRLNGEFVAQFATTETKSQTPPILEINLPRIKPARLLSESEAETVRLWLKGRKERGQKYSKNEVLTTMFGGKNSVLDSYLMQALGNEAEIYFPRKVLA